MCATGRVVASRLRFPTLSILGLAFALPLAAGSAVAPTVREPAGSVRQGVSTTLAGSAVVNLSTLAAEERRRAQSKGAPEVRPRIPSELNEAEEELAPEPGATGEVNFPPGVDLFRPPLMPFAASPTPTGGFMGLDDIPMVDSSYVIIPPDVAGGVGPALVMESFNNNYRIRDKATGATVVTVGTATFWNPVVVNKALLNQLTDPRTCYDPIQNRWIVAMQTVNDPGLILFGVSLTADPTGSWFLYAVTPGFTSAPRLDFPILGFNKNWIVITINGYTSPGAFQAGGTMIADYAQARAGTLSSVTNITQGASTHFCSAPSVTLSATEDTMFVVTHLASASATYQVDIVTGTPAAPVYTSGGTNTRPGGGWTQPSGNILPQSAPNSGASACGAAPCKIETQDAQIRSAPIFRVDATTGRGFIYYAQTVALPAATLTRTAVQWTKITAATTPAFADGGRIEDPTATATNGGKWYAYPHIAVNANGDFMVGYTQFSSAQHPAAGYSVHQAGDAAGTIRDPQIYHTGEDYYHKTYSTTTGRNRWGDFSTAQVDPSDDMTLWTLQEYGKTRPGTNDGNTGANSSRWSTWWAALAPPNVTIDVGPSQNEGNSGNSTFAFTARLSYAYGLPVKVFFHTSDGSATVANNDYQSLNSTVIIPAGATTIPINITVKGDTSCETDETFSVTLTSASDNIPLGATVTATGTILNDETYTITASAGAGGIITPSGAVVVSCNTNQSFTIAPDLCHVIQDVVVDGASQGAQTSYTFNSVSAAHTITASFLPNMTLGETHTHVSCNGVTDGAIDLTVTGGTGGLTYAWSNGASTQDISGLAAGSYSVTVTDANSCTATLLNVSITQPAVLALSETHVDVTTCGGTNGSIDLSVAGGTGPYGYAWSNGATTQDLSGLATGSYTVTVTDAHLCTEMTTVNVSAPGAPGLSETHANVSCNGGANGSIDLTVAGGTGPFTYAWSNGAITQDLSGLVAGTYNVTVTDASSCSALLGVTVTQPAVLALSETHTNVCTGGTNGSIDLTVAGGTGPYGYAWTNGATTEDLSGLAAGSYTVTVTDAQDCTQNLGVTIAVSQSAIVASAGANGAISPPGTTNVPCGTDQSYTITPDPNYTVSQLLVDASPVTPATSFTFTNVTANHTIHATFAAVTAVAAAAPAQFALGSVMPNPTHGGMQVPFGLPRASRVRVSIVDPQGRELTVIADGEYPAGWHTAAWSGLTSHGPAGSGLYFVRCLLQGQALMRKFVLAR